MASLSRDELKDLLAPPPGKCVSLFVPTERAGREVQQGPIHLKNLLREAEQQLLAQGLRRPAVTALLGPAHDLEADHAFWPPQGEGLAIFLAPEFFRPYVLPLAVEPLVVVAERFHIKPLLPLFGTDGLFYVLALSQNEVRLFGGTRDQVSEIALHDAPQNLAEVLQYDVWEKQLQSHAAAQPGVRGERSAIFFGHGGEANDAKASLARYFQEVDAGVRQRLIQAGTPAAPLVLAGVDYLLPLYREASDYPNLTDAGLPGNPEVLRPEELHARAWDIVQPIFQTEQQRATEHYQRLAGLNSPLASADVRDIVPAASYGRVETLFVDWSQHQWGVFDPATQAVHVHRAAEPGDEDLLDLAAAQAFLNGGGVYALKRDEMPVDAPIAATFRY